MREDTSCCYQCQKRKLYCRRDCEAWAAHEAAKQKRYQEKEARRAEKPKLMRQERNEKFRIKEFKTKGKTR